jgi:hypothetical protein
MNKFILEETASTVNAGPSDYRCRSKGQPAIAVSKCNSFAGK